jgi:hypothetical protein
LIMAHIHNEEDNRDILDQMWILCNCKWPHWHGPGMSFCHSPTIHFGRTKKTENICYVMQCYGMDV